jgi:hypothetical protein
MCFLLPDFLRVSDTPIGAISLGTHPVAQDDG